MAGKLHNRSIPSALELDMIAGLKGQSHVCPSCGRDKLSAYMGDPPRCDECDDAPRMYPLWDIRDSRGRKRGQVCGVNHADALQSALQSPLFDRLKALTATPATVYDL